MMQTPCIVVDKKFHVIQYFKNDANSLYCGRHKIFVVGTTKVIGDLKCQTYTTVKILNIGTHISEQTV